MFQLNMGRYPTTDEGLIILLEPPKDEETLRKWKAAGGPFLESASPLADPWGRPLIYVCPGVHNKDSYDLSSAGPDGQPGTADDVTNW